MIRRFVVVLVVAMSFGLVALVAPSGGATAGETCKQLLGSAYFKPPLPAFLSNTKVPLKLTTANGSTGVNYCTGPAGLYGKILLTVTAFTKTNCKALMYGSFPATTKGTATITWAKGK